DYEVSHDDVRDTRHDVGLRMRIPLSGGKPVQALASLSHQQRRMLDGIERDTDIVTGRSKRENVEDALTGTDFERVAYADATTDVSTTSRGAGDNSLIILNGTVTDTQEVQANQTLQGGGSTIEIRGRRTGLVVPFTAPGAAGRVTEPPDEASLEIEGSNTHVAGLTIVGAAAASGNNGVRVGNYETNVFLTDVNISDVGNAGISIGRWNEITIEGGSIARTGSNGIVARDNNSISIIGGSIKDVSENGIRIDDGNTVTIAGITIDGTTFDAIRIGEVNTSVRIHDVSISNAGLRGISIGNDNQTITIAGVSITTTGDDGITIGSDNVNVALESTSVVDTGESGIVIGSTLFALFDQVEISDTTEVGIEIGEFSNVVVNNSTLTDIGQNAFQIYQGSELRIANTTIAGSVGGHIFSFLSGTSTVLPDSSGNVNNVTSLGGQICNRESGGAPSGDDIAFIDGTFVNATTCP
ncbi:MAG: right-handed parallel beta-helix repeat-containing protein, partial [Pseudomonadota bacterium]